MINVLLMKHKLFRDIQQSNLHLVLHLSFQTSLLLELWIVPSISFIQITHYLYLIHQMALLYNLRDTNRNNSICSHKEILIVYNLASNQILNFLNNHIFFLIKKEYRPLISLLKI